VNEFEAAAWQLWTEKQMNTHDIFLALRNRYPSIDEASVHRAVGRVGSKRWVAEHDLNDKKARGVI
jgi:hypothetical protein